MAKSKDELDAEIKEAFEKGDARRQVFWKRNKVSDDDIAKASIDYQKFLKSQPDEFASKTPLGFRIFVLGWSLGRRYANGKNEGT